MPHYTLPHDLQLECGERLRTPTVFYQTWGSPNADQSNVVWVCHALTANADVMDWWAGLFGPGCCFDAARHYIICANTLGSCYGSTEPLSAVPGTQAPYYYDFPLLTIRDMVAGHRALADHLGIERISVLIGGSIGGQQVLEWAIQEPERIRQIVPIATNAKHSPWGIAFNASQRMAIETDPTWGERQPNAGAEGMKVARSIALLSYRNYDTYDATQQTPDERITDYRAESYQRYQGEKLARRFNALSYHYLTRAMDSHDVGRGKGGAAAALQRIQARALVIGVANDLLFPVAEQELLAAHIPDATFDAIDSPYGHDGFLLETAQLTDCISRWLS